MKVAYIAGPYRAETPWKIARNIRAASEVALKYSKLGYAVICPHANTAHMDGELPDSFWLEATLELMRRCDVVVMMAGWRKSSGARAEYVEANRLGKSIVLDWVGHEHGPVAEPQRGLTLESLDGEGAA